MRINLRVSHRLLLLRRRNWFAESWFLICRHFFKRLKYLFSDKQKLNVKNIF